MHELLKCIAQIEKKLLGMESLENEDIFLRRVLENMTFLRIVTIDLICLYEMKIIHSAIKAYVKRVIELKNNSCLINKTILLNLK
jgi:hypothetical protein